ncbi:hypothetical protein ACFLT5_01625 [Chloroflexota bacterium]
MSQAEERGGTVFVGRRIVESALPAIRLMTDFDSDSFAFGLGRRFVVAPVERDSESLWSRLTFP